MDTELLRVLGEAFSSHGIDPLAEALSPDCTYHSDYANRGLSGKDDVLAHMKDVLSRTTEDKRYSYEIVSAKTVLRDDIELLDIYAGNNCIQLMTQGEIVAFVFISLDVYGKIDCIYLSRDPKYLRHKFLDADQNKNNIISVKELLSSLYGENSLEAMRSNSEQFQNENEAYMWRQANRFVEDWLPEQGYRILSTEIEDDCIGYHCKRKDVDYTIFVYAYGEKKTTQLDGDYCHKLTRLPFAKNSIVLVLYLHIVKETDEDGKLSFKVQSYSGEDGAMDFWRVATVEGKNIFDFYPRKEMNDMVLRFIAAFNKRSLDILQAILSHNAYIEDMDGGRIVSNGVYGHFSYLYERYGEMGLAYVRYDDAVYSSVPYLEGFGFFDFSVTSGDDKICRFGERRLDGLYKELFTAKMPADDCLIDIVPAIKSVDFLPPEETQRFAIKVCFENGEVKKYRLPIDRENEKDEVVSFSRYVFTDKIFANGWVSAYRAKPEDFAYRDYPECGQGIDFINGFSISAVQLYHDSVSFYDAVICDEMVFEDDRVRIVKQLEWPGSSVNVDEETGLLKVLLPGGEAYNWNCIATFALPDGRRATNLDFIYLGSFCDGLAMVCVPGYGYGFIDENMKFVISPQYNRAGDFSGGYAKVSLWEDGRVRWFYVDKNGKELIFKGEHARDYTTLRDISESMFRVSVDIDDDVHFNNFIEAIHWLAYHHDDAEYAGVWGFVDENGNEIVSPQYIFAYDFQDGLALVCKGKWEFRNQWDERKNTSGYWSKEILWGFIDKTGKEVIPCRFDEIGFFQGEDTRHNSQYFKAHIGGWKTGKWGVIDQRGDWVIEPVFEDVDYAISDEGCVAFYAADKWSDDNVPMGVYSITEKKVLFEPQFLDVSFLDNGVFEVEVYDEKLGREVERLIDRDGKPLFDSEYTAIYTWKYPYEVMIREEGKPDRHGLIDKNGNEILQCKHDVAWNGISTEKRRIAFHQNGKYGVMDFDENIIIPAIYDDILGLDSEFLHVRLGEKDHRLTGLLTQDGMEVFPVRFHSIDVYADKIITRGDSGSEIFRIEKKG